MTFDPTALEEACQAARQQLMAWRRPGGYWEGELSSSALSTATAVCALALVDRAGYGSLIRGGLDWLSRHRNADGGWGDTVLSDSNISTTLLVWAAYAAAGAGVRADREAVTGAESWLIRQAGGLEPEQLAAAITRRYGKDRTFAVPILTMSALAGRLGGQPAAWRWVPALPFELATVPHRWLKWLRLPVVSYALPALIAIGQVKHHHHPPRNPVTRIVRNFARSRSLEVLSNIQPTSGGFLEAVPLTSFVAMSLAAMGQRDHGVVRRGVGFLSRSVRGDGSWPIDTNLATWVTTLAVNARAVDAGFAESLPDGERRRILDWLLGQQHLQEHPYTHADPGGWAWTDLPGGVPDADDTAGVLLALRNLGPRDERVHEAAAAGVRWLVTLQNRDGGVPTFCRGWGKLPFDRSGADLTAHALRALAAWMEDLPIPLRKRARRTIRRGIRYLRRVQKGDGSWVPLWFGNQHAAGEENPIYGTSRVLMALRELAGLGYSDVCDMLERGARWLVAAQYPDGGWGHRKGEERSAKYESSVEETAVAVDALAGIPGRPITLSLRAVEEAVAKGAVWLIQHTDGGKVLHPSPIGFYFAKLWYFERLYPVVFAVSALEQVRNCVHDGKLCAEVVEVR